MKKHLTFLIFCSILFIGCAGKGKSVTIYPISTQDIEILPHGTTCQVPEYKIQHAEDNIETIEAHEFKVRKDGRFISDFYIGEVMDAQEIKKQK